MHARTGVTPDCLCTGSELDVRLETLSLGSGLWRPLARSTVVSFPMYFRDGCKVRVIRSCLPGDFRLVGKTGTVVRTTLSGGVLVRFGPFWRARVETCFPDELEAVVE